MKPPGGGLANRSAVEQRLRNETKAGVREVSPFWGWAPPLAFFQRWEKGGPWCATPFARGQPHRQMGRGGFLVHAVV